LKYSQKNCSQDSETTRDTQETSQESRSRSTEARLKSMNTSKLIDLDEDIDMNSTNNIPKDGKSTEEEVLQYWLYYVFYYDRTYFKFGCSSNPGVLTIDEKVSRFKMQYLRMLPLCHVYMVRVTAPMYQELTVRQWEAEFKKRIDNLRPRRLEFSQSSEADMIAKLLCELAKRNQADRSLYECATNESRCEVRSLFNTENECIFDSLIPIIQDLAQVDGMNLTNMSRKRARVPLVQHPLHFKRESMSKDFDVYARSIYTTYGYAVYSTTADNHNEGGGNLPLDISTAFHIGFNFFCMIPIGSYTTTLYIYWMGCAFGEEVLCIAFIAKKYHINIHFVCMECNAQCMDVFRVKIETEELQDFFTLVHANLYTVYTYKSNDSMSTSVNGSEVLEHKYLDVISKCQVMYTSASLHPSLSLKLLEQCIVNTTINYLFCSNDTLNAIAQCLFDGRIRQLNKKLFVQGRLYTDSTTSGEPTGRDICFVNIK